MKRVLFVATVVKRHIMAFHIPYLEWFKEQGFEVHVCAHNDYEDQRDCMIPYCDYFHELSFCRAPIRARNIRAYRNLKHLMDTYHFDVIHCHTPVGGVLARLAARSARRRGTKVIYTAHGFHFYKGAKPISWFVYYPIERFLARYTDTLVTINSEDFKAAKNFKAKQIYLAHGVGIDLSKVNATVINRAAKRKELGIPPHSFLVNSVGELSMNKNHKVMLEALALIKNPAFHYAICGNGPLEESLLRYAEKLGIREQVHLMGYRDDVFDIMKASDLFVFPSFREGLSVALMESMAVGLPLVVSKIRGNIDLVKHGYNGYVIGDNRPQSYAQAILTLHQDNAVRQTFTQNSYKALKQYSIQNVLQEMSVIYTETMNQHQSKHLNYERGETDET